MKKPVGVGLRRICLWIGSSRRSYNFFVDPSGDTSHHRLSPVQSLPSSEFSSAQKGGRRRKRPARRFLPPVPSGSRSPSSRGPLSSGAEGQPHGRPPRGGRHGRLHRERRRPTEFGATAVSTGQNGQQWRWYSWKPQLSHSGRRTCQVKKPGRSTRAELAGCTRAVLRNLRQNQSEM